ncbi:MAG: hypothetical protein AVDCRST_MAG19-3274 [uncultured Thermomicrobiales bacterium]|uniref:Uncharacterized protein n=1 Tax=uncultured Thermomicrobiales bacterium TaxID=1645740 RepID=A0A6J4VD42_9BACT|nr:MAG: hypothetical protein AVDCRST_MAG19-3274 [uncultured Thermomicrobiales bacterium]
MTGAAGMERGHRIAGRCPSLNPPPLVLCHPLVEDGAEAGEMLGFVLLEATEGLAQGPELAVALDRAGQPRLVEAAQLVDGLAAGVFDQGEGIDIGRLLREALGEAKALEEEALAAGKMDEGAANSPTLAALLATVEGAGASRREQIEQILAGDGDGGDGGGDIVVAEGFEVGVDTLGLGLGGLGGLAGKIGLVGSLLVLHGAPRGARRVVGRRGGRRTSRSAASAPDAVVQRERSPGDRWRSGSRAVA